MTEVRYTVTGLPPGPAGALSAFLPHWNRYAASGAQSYKYGIINGPASYHPAPTTDTAPSPDLGDLSMAGTSRSSNCPDGWWIDDYNLVVNDQERPGAGMPIQFYSPTQPGLTTVLPVPIPQQSNALRADSALLARKAILQRVKQLPWWPRTWPTDV